MTNENITRNLLEDQPENTSRIAQMLTRTCTSSLSFTVRANSSLHFTDEESLEAAGTVIPLKPFAVPVPELQAMLFFAILISEIIWFADVPILKRDRPAVRHPEEGSFLSLIGAGCPKVFMTKTEVLDVLLKPVVLLL